MNTFGHCSPFARCAVNSATASFASGEPELPRAEVLMDWDSRSRRKASTGRAIPNASSARAAARNSASTLSRSRLAAREAVPDPRAVRARRELNPSQTRQPRALAGLPPRRQWPPSRPRVRREGSQSAQGGRRRPSAELRARIRHRSAPAEPRGRTSVELGRGFAQHIPQCPGKAPVCEPINSDHGREQQQLRAFNCQPIDVRGNADHLQQRHDRAMFPKWDFIGH